MQNIITTILLCFILTQAVAQERQVSGYLQGQYNKTIHDATIGNNPSGVGLGLQLFYNKNVKLKPTIELTADAYLEDDKVMRFNSDESVIDAVGGMVNVFAGVSYHPSKTYYFSVVAGPSFLNGQSLFGLKPSIGWYFSQKQRWTGKISYINVFNRDAKSKDDFGSLSLSLGIKLF